MKTGDSVTFIANELGENLKGKTGIVINFCEYGSKKLLQVKLESGRVVLATEGELQILKQKFYKIFK